MSNDSAILETQPAETQQTEVPQAAMPSAPNARWQRMTFAGVTPGNPPSVTFHAVGQTQSGVTRHFSQAMRVTNESVLFRLMKLSVGVEVRACIETDWNAPNSAVTLRDFCRIEPSEAPELTQEKPTS